METEHLTLEGKPRGMLESWKIRIGGIGTIVAVGAHFLGAPWDLVRALIDVTITLIAGQAAADFGKEGKFRPSGDFLQNMADRVLAYLSHADELRKKGSPAPNLGALSTVFPGVPPPSDDDAPYIGDGPDGEVSGQTLALIKAGLTNLQTGGNGTISVARNVGDLLGMSGHERAVLRGHDGDQSERRSVAIAILDRLNDKFET